MTLGPQLGTFLAVAEAGGFGRAARRLGVSQPAVSYRIRQLEHALGTSVVERGTGRFQLTPVGRRLAQMGRQFAEEIAGLRRSIAAGESQLTGPLRIAAVSGFGRYVLFPALLKLDMSPLELYYRTAEEVLTLLRNGDVDLGYVYVRLPSRAVRFRPVFLEQLVLVVPRTGASWQHVDWMHRGAERVPFVTYEEHDYVFGKWFRDVVGTLPRRLETVAHFDELEEAIEAVANGWGASIVPADAATAFGMSRVRRLRPAGRSCTNQIFQIERARPPGSPLSEIRDRIAAAIKRQ
jgi:DNA-binding transcriptional LysR family regulator